MPYNETPTTIGFAMDRLIARAETLQKLFLEAESESIQIALYSMLQDINAEIFAAS